MSALFPEVATGKPGYTLGVKATVIISLRSRRSERSVEGIRSLLSARGVRVDQLVTAEDRGALRKRLKRAVRDGAELIVVGGGDGAMTTAADVLAHSDAVLGLLPLGTGNSFAQTLGIGDDLRSAGDIIAAGRVAKVDLGVVNGTYFANFATVGFPSDVAAATSHELKRVIGPAAYAVAAVRPLLTHQPFSSDVRWGGGHMKLRTHQIVIANGRFFGRQPVLPEATITDGKLAFFATTGLSRISIIRTYLAFGLGTHARLADARTFYAERIDVQAHPSQAISIDGDSLDRTPARFRVARRALKVLVPATFSE
jgi:diacylglycerol kinase (ATP)